MATTVPNPVNSETWAQMTYDEFHSGSWDGPVEEDEFTQREIEFFEVTISPELDLSER